MDDMTLLQASPWALGIYAVVHLFREWLLHRRLAKRDEAVRQQQQVIVKAHNLLPPMPSHILTENEVWGPPTIVNKVEEAKQLLSNSIPPKKE
jgi:hypothetical protein